MWSGTWFTFSRSVQPLHARNYARYGGLGPRVTLYSTLMSQRPNISDLEVEPAAPSLEGHMSAVDDGQGQYCHRLGLDATKSYSKGSI